MKTLKEVKEHFKDAELIKSCLNEDKGLVSDSDEKGIHEDINAFWITIKKTGVNIMLYDNDNPYLGIAKILKTK